MIISLQCHLCWETAFHVGFTVTRTTKLNVITDWQRHVEQRDPFTSEMMCPTKPQVPFMDGSEEPLCPDSDPIEH